MKMRIDESFYIDPIGLARGLALWWTNDVKISILSYGKNFIDTKVSSNEDEWFLTLIYGPPYAEEKQAFREFISSLRSNYSEKCCLIGDTNIVVSSDEKLGGTFTCSDQRSEGNAILEKLDRILVSTDWSRFFHKAIGVLDASIASNHAPIYLLLK
ncbi:hypothetical protein V6N11_077527 [Hibiscus sabdariffa]|uniref:Uncharacterized protein n=1 Tax=Hibiscus sabdariffa TaxID=183260 RepID=A0ABR2TDB7_9ROSI